MVECSHEDVKLIKCLVKGIYHSRLLKTNTCKPEKPAGHTKPELNVELTINPGIKLQMKINKLSTG